MLDASITNSACDTTSANAAALGSRLAGSPVLGVDRALAGAPAFAAAAPGGRRAPGGAWRWHVHHAHD